MRRLSMALLVVLLGGHEALAVARRDVTNMNCEQIKALLRSEGSAILRFPASEVAGLKRYGLLSLTGQSAQPCKAGPSGACAAQTEAASSRNAWRMPSRCGCKADSKSGQRVLSAAAFFTPLVPVATRERQAGGRACFARLLAQAAVT